MAPGGWAQTPTTVSTVSGNGQLICPTCVNGLGIGIFLPMYAKVTDANGNPVPGTAVDWALTSGSLQGTLSLSQTVTDNNGLTSNLFNISTIQASNINQGFVQATITASVPGATAATFILTEGLQNPLSSIGSVSAFDASSSFGPGVTLIPGNSISGQVGSTNDTPIKVGVSTDTGIGVPNVAVNIYNLQPGSTGPQVQCASGAGAGDFTVLTNQQGIATCNPVFGGAPGNGQFKVEIGGVLSTAGDPNTLPQAFAYLPGLGAMNVTVTPGNPAALKLVSGNGQSAQAGQSLAAPLVVQVLSADGHGLAGQTVNWTVSPAGAATVTSSTTTDTNGNASTTVKLNSSASGTVNVTAILANSNLPSVGFTIGVTPTVTVNGLSIVSGDAQTAIVNQSFGSPLVVQLNATGGVASGIPVQFTVTGPGVLSASTVNTGSNGQAQVTVTAGSAAGAVTVTATATAGTQTYSQTFHLTVSPPGPSLSASGFVNGADFQLGKISPCSIATIIAPGLAPGMQGMVSASLTGMPQFLVAGDKVTVNGASAPIYSVGLNTATGQEQVTFQVPCDVTPGASVPVVVNVGAGSGSVNVPVLQASPGIFMAPYTDGTTHPIIVRPDGTVVDAGNPARKGETVVAFATGLGPSNPAVSTRGLAPEGVVIAPQYTVVTGMAGAGVPLVSAELSDEVVGLWLVSFTIPSTAPSGNVTFSISVIPTGSATPIPSATGTIHVQ